MSKAAQILAGLGGADNIVDTEPCITRIRVQVRDPDLVDEPALKRLGVFGVVRTGKTVQVVVGPEADALTAELNALLPQR